MGLYLKKRKKFLKKILLGAGLACIGALAFGLAAFLGPRLGAPGWAAHPLLAILMMSLVSLVLYKPLDIALNQLFRNYLFKSKAHAHGALSELLDELTLVLDLQEFANLVVNTFGEVLQLKTAVLLVPNRVRGDFEIISAYGCNVSEIKRVRLTREAPIIRFIQASGKQVITRRRAVKALEWQEANVLAHDFDRLSANWIIPFFVRDELTGALGFSAQDPQEIFDEADFHFFREFGRQAAKSLYNALSVTELRNANSQLQDIQSQLLQSTKLAAIEKLATGIAHEIHNPLTIISGKAQVLLLRKDQNRLDERVEEVLKTIVKQTKRAADITRKLLMFSQGSGAPKEMLRLERVLEDTIALISYQTSLEGIEITRTFPPCLPTFYANIHELREVFLNLVLNAVESVGSKGRIHCEIAAKDADQLIEIAVSDTGKGISPEHLDKLFDPFFTTRQDAAGLGLFVTKQIVHRYGGAIRVESRIGEGSLFKVQLPYQESPVSVESSRQVSASLFPGAQL